MVKPHQNFNQYILWYSNVEVCFDDWRKGQKVGAYRKHVFILV